MGFRLDGEIAFLRELLRGDPDRLTLERIRRENEWFDWDYFEEILFTSRVVPVVAHRFGPGSSFAELVPEGLARRITAEGEKTVARSLLKERELRQVLSAFDDSRIPSIVLKGLCFAGRFYAEESLRETRDLDLLVPFEYLTGAERTLTGLGYTLFEGIHSRAYYRRHHFHVVYARRGLGVDVVELHWNLLPHPEGLAVDTEALFREAGSYEHRGIPVRVLSPLDEVAHLCASLRMAQFASLKRMVDLERMARRLRRVTPAGEILRRGESWGIPREVAASLYLLERFWGEEGAFPGVAGNGWVRRFASRFRGRDFFGVGASREIRLRLWNGYHFGGRSPGSFMGRLLFPDEDFRAKMFFSEEGPDRASGRVRRFFAGLASLTDLAAHLLLSRFRARP
ncbi:MAG: nucleotidyltransferase family protein [Candidatus Eisenbacteria bacterium]